jgi:DNA-binding ferritin-like protein
MLKSRINRTRINKTRKNTSIGKSKKNNNLEQEIVLTFLQTLNMIKLYHWKTYSYATHKATDELYFKLNDHMDSFVEIMLGKHGDRVNLTRVKSISLKDYTSVSDFKREILKFREFLIKLNTNKSMENLANTDLYNVRDEILGDINQFLYLLTFK